MTPNEAKEWFKRCGRAREHYDILMFQLKQAQTINHGSSMASVGGGGVSDPTARTAQAVIDAKAEFAEAERELVDTIEHCSRVCHGCGLALGHDVEFILAKHYVYGETVESVAASMGISRATVNRRMNAAYEYVATVGLSNAELGRGVATIGDAYGRASEG